MYTRIHLRKGKKSKHTESCSDFMTGATATDNISTKVDSSSVNSNLATPLTRNDILNDQEIMRQLRPENNKVHNSPSILLVPNMLINFGLFSRVL